MDYAVAGVVAVIVFQAWSRVASLKKCPAQFKPPRVLLRPQTTPKLIIFDLDFTLLNVRFDSHPDLTLDRLPAEGGLASVFFDVDFFRHFMQCCADYGHVVRIATFASVEERPFAADRTPDLVAGLMRRTLAAGDLCEASHIVCGSKDASKMQHYISLVESVGALLHNRMHPSSVIVIDDTLALVAEARQALYKGFVCDGGFTRDWFQRQPQLWELLGFRDELGRYPQPAVARLR